MTKINFVVVLALLVSLTICNQYPIKNVVVLMMENRSYDHMLGWMKQGGEYGNPDVNGLTGNECNYKNPFLPFLGKICVSPDAPDNSLYDPSHAHEATTERIFGCNYSLNIKDKNIKNPCVNHASSEGDATMGGFVMSSKKGGHNGLQEMSAQLSSNVPIITTLANQYAQFDHYFCSYPGPTNPNRLFVHCGTCDGCLGNEQKTGQIQNKTLQEVLANNNLTWRYYYENDADDWFLYIDYFNKNFNSTLFPPMEQFYTDAANGNLPNYTFINPSESINPNYNNTKSFGLMNDQHPNHSVREGERLMKNVYEALRNGPLWNQTLLIITYDEHGGFYDHVSPPQNGVPNPDGKKNKNGFDFTRLGIRVPMLMISPWIEKGTLIKEPAPNQKPFETSQFEHSSIISSILKIFGINEYFSKRTEWAATFDDLLLKRSEPRTDCPTELAYIPPPTQQDIERLYNLPLKDRLIQKVQKLCRQVRRTDENCGKNVKTYKELNHFLNHELLQSDI
ncbi:hypothetical protein ABPG74_021889 [Tetrahymena malaccensis]